MVNIYVHKNQRAIKQKEKRLSAFVCCRCALATRKRPQEYAWCGAIVMRLVPVPTALPGIDNLAGVVPLSVLLAFGYLSLVVVSVVITRMDACV